MYLTTELGNYLKQNNISIYSLFKESGIPYTTLSSLAKGRSDPKECGVGTLLRLSKILNTSLDSLIVGDIKTHHFINDNIILDINTLPKSLRNDIKELEQLDEKRVRSSFQW